MSWNCLNLPDDWTLLQLFRQLAPYKKQGLSMSFEKDDSEDPVYRLVMEWNDVVRGSDGIGICQENYERLFVYNPKDPEDMSGDLSRDETLSRVFAFLVEHENPTGAWSTFASSVGELAERLADCSIGDFRLSLLGRPEEDGTVGYVTYNLWSPRMNDVFGMQFRIDQDLKHVYLSRVGGCPVYDSGITYNDLEDLPSDAEADDFVAVYMEKRHVVGKLGWKVSDPPRHWWEKTCGFMEVYVRDAQPGGALVCVGKGDRTREVYVAMEDLPGFGAFLSRKDLPTGMDPRYWKAFDLLSAVTLPDAFHLLVANGVPFLQRGDRSPRRVVDVFWDPAEEKARVVVYEEDASRVHELDRMAELKGNRVAQTIYLSTVLQEIDRKMADKTFWPTEEILSGVRAIPLPVAGLPFEGRLAEYVSARLASGVSGKEVLDDLSETTLDIIRKVSGDVEAVSARDWACCEGRNDDDEDDGDDDEDEDEGGDVIDDEEVEDSAADANLAQNPPPGLAEGNPWLDFSLLVSEKLQYFKGQPEGLARIGSSPEEGHEHDGKGSGLYTVEWPGSPCPIKLSVWFNDVYSDRKWSAAATYMGRTFKCEGQSLDDIIKDYNETYDTLLG